MSETCIFCLDGDGELLENASCSCHFRTHQPCWDRYVASKHPLTCPTCRKQIVPKIRKAPIPLIPIPTAPSLDNYNLQEDIYISIPAEQSHQQSIRKKPTKFQAVIMALVLVGFWILVMKIFEIF